MSDLEAVLREIREFRRETADGLNGIREDLRTTNVRIDEAERRIAETEERVLNTEEITRELIKLHKRIEERQIDQEGRARRENIRLHGIKEGAEKNVESVGSFVEVLLREKLELPPEYQLNLERAHRALGPPPSEDAPPRSIVAKFSSYKCKEDIIKKAWEKKGFLFEGKRLQRDLVDVLNEFRGDNLDLTTHVTVVARRRRVLHSACVALQKSYFEWHETPNIEFVGEMAENYGGPRREFFR
ncbi:LINE-1 type transposase domain-containing protein [Pimephales promelas]|nr:LINE-1 type transposase domain-containing protein [Pimephales promelas]